MLKKLIVVYNPRSSKHAVIAQEVLAPARKLSGWLVGKYEVKEAGLDDNAAELAKILNDGDLVVVAGGDGTAAMTVNGIMQSEKDVALGVLGYGNFNDLARMLKAKRAVEYGGEYIGGVTEIVERFEAGKVREIYPLEAIVDGKHWRYAPCYLSLGLLAESTAVFDEPKVREKLKTGKKGMLFSVWTLAKWYFRNRKRDFLPQGKIMAVRDVVEAAVGPKTETQGKMLQVGKQAKVKLMIAKNETQSKLTVAKTEALGKLSVVKTEVQAKLAVAKTGTKARLLNAKLKTQDRIAAWSEKVRERRGREAPEIIIEGVEVVEQRKKDQGKKKMACAVEKTRKNRLKAGMTDYIAVNGLTLAKMMRGGRYYKKPVKFRSATVRLGSFWRLMGFMIRSILLRVPGRKTRGDVIKFKQRSNVMIQAEGEYEMLTGVKRIVVKKAERGIKVVRM